MRKEEKVALFIPARGGSKSIPRKNIKPLCGHPLIYWTCLAGQDCADISTIYVATDDDEIKSVVEGFGFDKLRVLPRSNVVSNDTASTESVVHECLREVKEDLICLAQCTSPLTTAQHFKEAILKFHEQAADSLVTVARQKRFFWQIFSGGEARPVNYNPQHRPRRQDFEGQLVENGAFYIFTKSGFIKSKCRLHGKIIAYEMPEETLVEIDEPDDWFVVEKLKQKILHP